MERSITMYVLNQLLQKNSIEETDKRITEWLKEHGWTKPGEANNHLKADVKNLCERFHELKSLVNDLETELDDLHYTTTVIEKSI